MYPNAPRWTQKKQFSKYVLQIEVDFNSAEAGVRSGSNVDYGSNVALQLKPRNVANLAIVSTARQYRVPLRTDCTCERRTAVSPAAAPGQW